jgi:hypothetical protein
MDKYMQISDMKAGQRFFHIQWMDFVKASCAQDGNSTCWIVTATNGFTNEESSFIIYSDSVVIPYSNSNSPVA